VEKNLKKYIRSYLFGIYEGKNRKKIFRNYKKIGLDIFLNKYNGQYALRLKN